MEVDTISAAATGLGETANEEVAIDIEGFMLAVEIKARVDVDPVSAAELDIVAAAKDTVSVTVTVAVVVEESELSLAASTPGEACC